MSTAEFAPVVRSSTQVGAATLASRVLGLARDVLLANVFERGVTDAFFMAFMIPNLFRRLVGEGSLTTAFVPVFTGCLRRSRDEARRFLNTTWTLAAALGLGITLGGILLADPLVDLFAPGFSLEPGKHALTVTLLRLCFPYIFFLMLVAVAMGALNAVGHFLSPAIAPVLLNLSLIAGAGLGTAGFFFPAQPILVLGAAVIVAGALQVALQLPVLGARGMFPRPALEVRAPAVRRLGSLLVPAVLGASVFQLNIVISRILASFLGSGAVSYLYYADRLLELPLGIFVVALGTASLPTFSRLAKSGSQAELRETFFGTQFLVLALALPSTVGLALLSESLIAVLFSWRVEVFDAVAVAGTGRALFLYALGLVPIGVSRICVGLCVAHENTRTPARAAVFSLVVNAAAALFLIGPLPAEGLPAGFASLQSWWSVFDLGYPGLALAASIASSANAAFLWWVVRRRYGIRLLRPDAGRLLRLIVASLVMGVVLATAQQFWPIPPEASLRGLAQLGSYVGGGLALYLLMLRALGSPELEALVRVLRRR